MNQIVPALPAETTLSRIILDVLFKALLVAVSTVVIISLHETLHLLTGRLLGIPAVFTGLTSAGLSKDSIPSNTDRPSSR